MKILFSISLACLISVTALTVAAQTTTPTTTEPRVSDAPSETAVETRQRVTDSGTELSAQRQERLTNLATNLSDRFDAVISRLLQIITRMETRVAKLEATGRDVSEARARLQTARTSLDFALVNMSDIEQLVNEFVTGTTPRENWSQVRNRYVQTRDLVRSAHAEMKAVVNILKNLPAPLAPEQTDESI